MKQTLLSISLALLSLFAGDAFADGFGFHAGSHIGLGRLGQDNTIFSKRSMYDINFEGLPGYEIGPFLAGILFDYGIVGQATSEQSAGNALGGKEYSLGLGLAFQPALWKILFSYDFIGKYSTGNGGSVPIGDLTFKSPSGFHLLGGYSVAPHCYFDMEYTSMNYSKQTLNGADSDISSNPINRWAFALGISVSY